MLIILHGINSGVIKWNGLSEHAFDNKAKMCESKHR